MAFGFLKDIGAGLIGGLGSVVGSLINKKSTKDTNREQMAWNEKMFNMQNKQNVDFWNMQNEYNSPQSQMARLQEAGLNPNLVYGTGSPSGSAGSIQSASPGSYNPRVPEWDLNSGIMAYFNAEQAQAQIDNLKTQNTVLASEAALKGATTAKVVQDTAKSQFDLGLASDLRQTSMDAAKENLRKLNIQNDVTLSANERAEAMNASNLKEAIERIENMRGERERTWWNTANEEQRHKLQQLDIDLRKNGIMPGDNLFMRVLGRILSGFDIGDWVRSRKGPSFP